MQIFARQLMLPLALFPLEAPTAILLFLGVLVIGAALGAVIALAIHNSRVAKDLKSAENRAKTVVDDAAKEAEQLKKSALIEAKEEILRQKTESDREIKERRSELQKSEKRLSQKEDTLDRKIEQNDKKSETLDKKIKEADAKRAQIEEIIQSHLERLEEIAGLTVEQAKEELIKRVETECRHDIAQRINDLEEEYRSTADEKAKNIISLAIQRCAADHVADITVTSVAIPNEERKGRIIGR
jgi:ribonuclease Y